MWWDGASVLLIDTAGLRRPGRVQAGVEKYSVLRARQALGRCDVALVVLDAGDGPTAQDAHIAGDVFQQAKGIVLVVNKIDLLAPGRRVALIADVRREIDFLSYAPVVAVSALTGSRVDELVPTAMRVQAERSKRVSTTDLNRLVDGIVAAHVPTRRGHELKTYYAVQVGHSPPTFVFFVNDASLVHFTYERFIENQMRRAFGFEGSPVRLIFRGRRQRPGSY
jgi:GTP-binding protein